MATATSLGMAVASLGNVRTETLTAFSAPSALMFCSSALSDGGFNSTKVTDATAGARAFAWASLVTVAGRAVVVQVTAGVDAIQVFDSWAGTLSLAVSTKAAVAPDRTSQTAKPARVGPVSAWPVIDMMPDSAWILPS